MKEVMVKCKFYHKLNSPHYDFCLNYLTSIFKTSENVKGTGVFDCSKELNPINCDKGYATLTWCGFIRYQNKL